MGAGGFSATGKKSCLKTKAIIIIPRAGAVAGRHSMSECWLDAGCSMLLTQLPAQGRRKAANAATTHTAKQAGSLWLLAIMNQQMEDLSPFISPDNREQQPYFSKK